jgi:hypothetical protein
MIDSALSSFAGACLKLNLLLGRAPHDVECALCEDGLTVMLMAPDDQGHFVGASFMLDEVADEETFDHRIYEAAF